MPNWSTRYGRNGTALTASWPYRYWMEDNGFGEALLAAVGINAVITKGKLRVTQDHRQKALRYMRTATGEPSAWIRREVKRVILAEGNDGEAKLPEFSFEDALEALTEQFTPERLQENISSLEGDEGVSFLLAAGQATSYLQAILPRRSRITPLGPVASPPSDQDISRFRRAFSVLDDVTVLFDEACEGTLARDQVRAAKENYPGIYAQITEALFLELAALRGERPRYTLPFAREKVVSQLLLTRTFSADLAKDMQAALQAEEQKAEPPQKSGSLRVKAENTETPTQRISMR